MPEEIKWKVREYSGCEVYLNVSDLDAHRTLKKKDVLVGGQEIVVPTLTGWTMAKVARDKYGDLHAETEHYVWPLEFSQDDRECWVAAGCINKKCLDKLKDFVDCQPMKAPVEGFTLDYDPSKK